MVSRFFLLFLVVFCVKAHGIEGSNCNLESETCQAFELGVNAWILKDFSVEIITPLTIGKVRRKEVVEVNEANNGKRGRQFSVIKVDVDKNTPFSLTCVPDSSYIYFQNGTISTLDNCFVVDMWNNLNENSNSLAGQNRPDDLAMPVYRLYLSSTIPEYASDGQVSGSIHLEFKYE